MDPEPSLPSWPDHLHDESLMTAPSDDEFANFLEFGMPFADLGTGQQRQQSLPPRSLPPSSLPPSSSAAPGQDQLVRMDTDPSSTSFDFHNTSSQDGVAQSAVYTTTAAITPGFYAQEQPPPFKSHPSQQPIPNGQTVIPPTPNSIELHGGAARYPHQVEDNHDMYSRINDEQVGSKASSTQKEEKKHKLMQAPLCATGLLHTPHFSCHDSVGDSISPSGIYHPRGILHSSHVPGTRVSKCQYE